MIGFQDTGFKVMRCADFLPRFLFPQSDNRPCDIMVKNVQYILHFVLGFLAPLQWGKFGFCSGIKHTPSPRNLF
ncbi:unknown protein [Microcystis aeruginosa NIES-843]|uniref:Uncharacterized protein n=1 Tax=Microcystis aeruginosa (strain NIES-843 / IAM M-2473) TaxID=449447 RepID=B0JJX2_MICAN|nr:unknown protein [Microcystis aeruginosa NIES-843]